MNKDDNYAYGIDAIRFVCALLVAVFHLTYNHADSTRAVPFGWVGVQIFFVISGVVIANSAYNSTPRTFLIGRFLRLYPAAWIAAAITIAIFFMVPWAAFKQVGVNVVPQLGALARSLALMGDYFLTSSYWTLPVELAFYAVVYLSLLAGLPLLWVARLLVLIAAPYLIAALLHYVTFINAPSLDFGNGLGNALLVKHGPYFAIGIYIWARMENLSLTLTDKILAGTIAVLILIEMTIKSLSFYPASVPIAERFAGSLHMILFSLTIFIILIVCVYASMKHRGGRNLSLWGKRCLRTVGLMTYPFYLLHESVGGAVLYASGSKAPALLPVVAACVATGFAAFVVSSIAEPWMRRQLKSRIPLLKDRQLVSPVAAAATR